jgi:hypothetical protein
LIPSNDAMMDYDGYIGPLVCTTGDSRISGDIVPLVNLINTSRTSEDKAAVIAHLLHLRFHLKIYHQCRHRWFMIWVVFHKILLKDCSL